MSEETEDNIGPTVFKLMAAALAIGGLLVFGVQYLRAPRVTAARSSCIAQLKQIDGAVQQWALANKKVTTDSYSLTEPAVLSFMKGSVLPICPHKGTYSAGTNISDAPRCSLGASDPAHRL